MMNRIIKINTNNYCLEEVKSKQGQGFFINATSEALHERKLEGIEIESMKRWVALSRVSPYWIEPFFGTEVNLIPKETQFLLWERTDGSYGIMLPLIDGNLRTVIMGSDTEVKLTFDGLAPFEIVKEAIVAYIGIGDTPYELISISVKIVADKLKTFKMREEKSVPNFVDYFGWCTWDAFYREVNEQKVLQGLQSFKEGGFQPGYMILDDGWLDEKEEALLSFNAHNEKFPRGLKGLIEEVKSKYNINTFGVWHAFVGYWLGVHPEGALAENYNIIKKQGKPRYWTEYDENIGFIDPKDVSRFYHDFHNFLSCEGVDMLKVDVQSSLEAYTTGTHGRVSVMKTYQDALQGSAQLNFSGNLIHCMSNSSDVAYHMKASMIWRNSDDFYPGRPEEGQQKHIHINAMNNVWTSTFSLPDWDMFQSHHPQGEFHAAARSICGGPIYICDKPYQQNFDIIEKLCISGGKVLRCESPAMPTLDCLFVDCYREAKLLKLSNKCGNIGILGLFHCQQNGGNITDTYSPSDIFGLEGSLFAVYYHTTQKTKVIKREEVIEITLNKLGYELITIAPVINGFAAIGLLDKFNSAAVINSVEETGDNKFVVSLKDGGDNIGLFCNIAPKKIFLDSLEVDYSYNEQSKLLQLSAPVGDLVHINIFM